MPDPWRPPHIADLWNLSARITDAAGQVVAVGRHCTDADVQQALRSCAEALEDAAKQARALLPPE